MMEFYKREVRFLLCVLIIIVFVCAFACLLHYFKIKPYDYVVTSSSGRTYYIDDYTIEDGTIIFTIDGVEYHFSNYSIREIEK